MHDYYHISRHPVNGKPVMSNSKLKELWDIHTGKQQNHARREKNFRFGGSFHTLLLEPEKFSNNMLIDSRERERLTGMYNALLDCLGAELVEMGMKEREYYCFMMSMYWKSKLDWVWQPDKTHRLHKEATEAGTGSGYYYPERRVIDFKTTGANTQEAFESDALQFGYDLQAYLYLNTSKAGSMDIIGIGKARPHHVFQINGIDRLHPFYESGRQKALTYITDLRCAGYF